ncbi:hypothetical protein [Streptomyces sp. NPDC056188]|uniref:hypothetical protein n=1 Tax=Streptomyces sp. NPDC056188 TaxID=3345740 RepID=UPI0035E3B111
MEICARAAADIDAFRTAARRADAVHIDAAELLVLTCDATGVNMIPSGWRDATPPPAPPPKPTRRPALPKHFDVCP